MARLDLSYVLRPEQSHTILSSHIREDIILGPSHAQKCPFYSQRVGILELHPIGSHRRYLGSNCSFFDTVVHCRCMRYTTHGVSKRQQERSQNLFEWSSGQLCDACASVCVRPAVGTRCRTVLAMCDVVMSSESGCMMPASREHGAVVRCCLALCGTIHMVPWQYRPIE